RRRCRTACRRTGARRIRRARPGQRRAGVHPARSRTVPRPRRRCSRRRRAGCPPRAHRRGSAARDAHGSSRSSGVHLMDFARLPQGLRSPAARSAQLALAARGLRPLAFLEPVLAQPPEQHVEPVLAEERLAAERTGGHTPVSGRLVILLVLLDHALDPVALAHGRGVALGEVGPRPLRCAREVIALVPVLGTAPDHAAHLVGELDAVPALRREHTEACQTVDVGLLAARGELAVAHLLDYRVRPGWRHRQAEILRHAEQVAEEVARPQRVQFLEELRRADRERVYGPEPDPERIAVLPLAEPRRPDVRPRAAERPEDVDLEGIRHLYSSSSASSCSASGWLEPTWIVSTQRFSPASFHACRRSRMRSFEPTRCTASTSSSGTAAAASNFFPARKRFWIFTAASSYPNRLARSL